MSARVTRSIALLCSVALWAGCSRRQAQKDTLALADSAGGVVVPPVAAPAPLTDANIFALLDEANAADSASGHLAASKATSPSVKEFGRRMMKDHHMLRRAGMDLAKKLNVTPAPPANDSMPMKATRMLDSLTAQAKGPEWDKAYMNMEVAAHQAVLALLTTAEAAAQAPELKATIVKVRPLVQQHLTMAQDIEAKLGTMAATPKHR